MKDEFSPIMARNLESTSCDAFVLIFLELERHRSTRI
jgi:hypothetical protein